MDEDRYGQAEYWNGEVGQRWARNRAVLDCVFAPLTDALFDAVALRPSATVLDIGCGSGDTTLRAASMIGAWGRVVGVDISAPLLAAARARPNPRGAPIAWLEADAETYSFAPTSFNAAISRFGSMFFADTRAAFANIRTALKPGARLTLRCWQPLADTPWVSVPREAILPLVPPPEPPQPGVPGPFRFADPAVPERALREAGFREITCRPVRRPVVLGRAADGTPEGAAEAAAHVACNLGPTSHLLREVDPALRARAHAAVVGALLPHAADGAVRLEAACWLITAG